MNLLFYSRKAATAGAVGQNFSDQRGGGVWPNPFVRHWLDGVTFQISLFFLLHLFMQEKVQETGQTSFTLYRIQQTI